MYFSKLTTSGCEISERIGYERKCKHEIRPSRIQEMGYFALNLRRNIERNIQICSSYVKIVSLLTLT